MGKIVAIGGGEMKLGETTDIDREIIRLTGKKQPRLLFLPTASNDAITYYDSIKQHFGKELGCKTDVLFLIMDKPKLKEIEKKILSADAVYVGGGNTEKMMRVWRRTGAAQVLKQAYDKGIILSGISAGAICWFRWGNSDSRILAGTSNNLIRVSGLDLVHALYCPHFDAEPQRQMSLKAMMVKTPGIVIAVDNCCAIEIVDEMYRIISTKPSANAYRIFWKPGTYHKKVISKRKEFRPLSHLLSKWALIEAQYRRIQFDLENPPISTIR
ncbi:MAG TPA: peptidase E [Dehalococcoidales bacterium]